MTLNARLRNHLIQSNLQVAQRIYPEIVPVDPVYPLIVINQPSGVPVHHRDGGQLRQVTKILKSYAETSTAAWGVAIELREAIRRFPGFIINEASAYETESARYLVVTVAQFWSQE
jgi:hypothetical protein